MKCSLKVILKGRVCPTLARRSKNFRKPRRSCYGSGIKSETRIAFSSVGSFEKNQNKAINTAVNQGSKKPRTEKSKWQPHFSMSCYTTHGTQAYINVWKTSAPCAGAATPQSWAAKKPISPVLTTRTGIFKMQTQRQWWHQHLSSSSRSLSLHPLPPFPSPALFRLLPLSLFNKDVLWETLDVTLRHLTANWSHSKPLWWNENCPVLHDGR